jgi:hypothetical protein
VFLSDGLHIITLTAVDPQGASDSISRQVTVILESEEEQSFIEEITDGTLTPSPSFLSVMLILAAVVYRRKD